MYHVRLSQPYLYSFIDNILKEKKRNNTSESTHLHVQGDRERVWMSPLS